MSKSPYLLTLVFCGWDRAALFFPQLTSSVNKLSVKVVVAVIVVSFINILFVVFSSGFIHVLSLKLNISLNHILRNETKCFCKQSAREYISFLCETLHTYLKLFFFSQQTTSLRCRTIPAVLSVCDAGYRPRICYNRSISP